MRKRIAPAVGAALLMLLTACSTTHHDAEIAVTTVTINQTELDYLAMTIWAEARGEGNVGMLSVGNVILNRALNGKFGGHLIQNVVTKPKQFSCWNPSDRNRKLLDVDRLEKLDPKTPDGRAWFAAKVIARSVMTRTSDPTQGALYYHTKAVSPSWAKSMRQVAQIGGHVFLI